MPSIEIQKTMFVDGEQVHVSARVLVSDAAHLTGGEMKALTDKLGWSIDNQFHVLDSNGNLVLESKGMTF
ncbi:hypothetical protein [Aliiruegeria lutimaris]|uniref:Uncharacterized protein n=1 Tax=Aliiruegeria lutimaris TaxID=571298 RepID=A0A1G9GGI1_9RHOB|nr:hypothetical protein [Aliiruegeria lutimaris]SDK99799.1 hypothetical protein SAMN04488026_106312 [Aliiruegeria lutimaris]